MNTDRGLAQRCKPSVSGYATASLHCYVIASILNLPPPAASEPYRPAPGPFRSRSHMQLRALSYAVLAGSLLALAGCNAYYMVRDPSTGMRYYTSDLDTPGGAGTVQFKDARTRRDVTLQN